jgi:hypothetical protein
MAKRIDPEDGQAYTFEEMASYYKGKYKKAVIESYWETCKPAKGAKGKSKEKAKPAPKAKTKAKAKVKAKAKAKKSPKPQKVIKVGAKLPDAEMFNGFPPAGGSKINILEYIGDKKVIIMGLPGAFTPC